MSAPPLTKDIPPSWALWRLAICTAHWKRRILLIYGRAETLCCPPICRCPAMSSTGTYGSDEPYATILLAAYGLASIVAVGDQIRVSASLLASFFRNTDSQQPNISQPALSLQTASRRSLIGDCHSLDVSQLALTIEVFRAPFCRKVDAHCRGARVRQYALV